MPSLVNCQPVQPYSAQEFPGDSGADENLEMQTPPSGSIFSGSPEQGVYYLDIKPNPGHRIDRSLVSVYDNSGAVIEPSNINDGSQFSYTGVDTGGFQQYPNGQAVYFLMGENATYPNINFIRIYDTLAGDFANCDNIVRVEVGITPEFVMPSNNVEIAIDFGGTAVQCNPPAPPPPPDPDPIETGTAPFQITSEIFVSNFQLYNDTMNDVRLFFAQYYETESHASSVYNFNNTESYMNGYAPPGPSQVPVYDWNYNLIQGANGTPVFTNYWEDTQGDWCGCLLDYQPTCYTHYNNVGFTTTGYQDPPTSEAPNTLSTLCGQMIASNPLPMQASSAASHPNPGSTTSLINRNSYIFKVYPNEDSMRFLSISDYPTIEPGGPVLPSALCWYVSVGNNDNWDLTASTEFIDVWKILTIQNNSNFTYNIPAGFGVPDPSFNWPCVNTPGTLGPLAGVDGWTTDSDNVNHFISDSTENNSDLDINNIELTQIDSKTVKIKIPFKSGLSISRFGPEESANFRRFNKIFINIYPEMITQPDWITNWWVY